MSVDIKNLKKQLPSTPGIYLMKSASGEILYIGKAANLKRRVMSYFERPADARISAMVAQIDRVDIRKTATALEALILESRLIKQHQPRYNVKEKDDKSFLFIVVTREEFPRVVLVRGTHLYLYERLLAQLGPFTSASAVRAAMDILRRIFPWAAHRETYNVKPASPAGRRETTNRKPCFDYQIGLCPGTCVGAISKRDYRLIIRQLIRFLRGGRRGIVRDLRVAMRRAAKELRFEDAAKLRKRLFALLHIEDVALISRDEIASSDVPHRIEGYDISNISGTSAVGSMVVFTDGRPDKSQYRKFRIKTVHGSNDVAMLREVIMRRFQYLVHRSVNQVLKIRNDYYDHSFSSVPDMILIDGGLPQVRAAQKVIIHFSLGIPVIGIAKGPERKRNDFIFAQSRKNVLSLSKDGQYRNLLIRVRDEAHRFAVAYHRKLREKIPERG